ncbi:MAG: hypothetical protein B7X59_03330 [Polaromonas sp. 39-63-203]|jgi:intracellular sulfur oxidation DsrE/DsrF family protein|uniref:DsrE family protein n=1 Tax=Polaromonas sp. TaxID=1869339 RepID=UPI000BC81CF0|nr:DsrE family protein [Polaromonas sp.]OYY53973.1 MAG: hypothetical protein B7Y54_00800 [Polaromonas sp. 35-63-240]OYZ03293.1 MAG: hypothetical protein B7Y42_01185 [Polaromonas sp. 28-63-22]OYZ85115.1 MAG: hypothetical protein B7Y03_00770 [Polaromonas sp. 24-62-144]OZA99950.1 MAG: hypothetical protein B7X59_03330 [Polaromonas sp. 39-63-203]HQS30669.1 DsrE family protein [Polaromonas sp.]
MNRKSFIQGTVMALGASIAVAATAQTASAAKSKLVLQVSDADPARWGLALNNAKNVQQELGAGKVDIEIVAYGPGIGMLKAEAPTANRITEAVQSGIKVVACENTMTAQKLTKADMHAAIGYAPSGVVEIMKRQGEGYAYVRP